MKTFSILPLFASLFISIAVAQTPTMVENFKPSEWLDNGYGELSDGFFKIDGDFCVGYNGAYPVDINRSNSMLGAASPTNPNNNLMLTVPPGTHTNGCGVVYGGSEIATQPGWEPNPPAASPFGPSPYNYGYYETSMKPSCVQGEISSFFWIQAPSYGPLEIDVEFPNAPGHTFNDVHWTLHPSGQTVDYTLPFNPCKGYHRYGFLWTAGQVQFTVDGVVRYTMTDPTLNTSVTGFIMANSWTGNPTFGGGPPLALAVNNYRWIKYGANFTTVPTW